MNRRVFLRNSIGLAALAYRPDVFLFSEKDHLRMIRELEDFAEDELGLRLKRKFYRKWLPVEQQLTYVYVSRSDSVLLPPGKANFNYFGTDTLKAKEFAKKESDEGFDTMIYRTSGTSATKLTHHLLAYPSEAVMFVVLHEMAHVHREKAKLKIPYPAEESFGDFLGNYASEKFAQKYYPQHLDRIEKQRRIQEEIYTLLKRTEKQTQGIEQELKNKRYTEVSAAMQELIRDANEFQRDRYNYPVNHAYILRNRYYYKWYDEFRKIHQKGSDLKAMVELYNSLPEKESEVSLLLKKKSA
ncbi:MAG: hypothetical protein R2850_01005 [Bacteroidia bacterium]